MKIFLYLVLLIAFLPQANARDKNDGPQLYLYPVKDKTGTLIKVGHFVARNDMKRAIGKAFTKQLDGGKGNKVGGFKKIRQGHCYAIIARSAKNQSRSSKYGIKTDKTMEALKKRTRKGIKKGRKVIEIACNKGHQKETNVSSLEFKASTCPAGSPKAFSRYWVKERVPGIFQIYGTRTRYTFNMRHPSPQKIKAGNVKLEAAIMSICGDRPGMKRRASLYERLKKEFYGYANTRTQAYREECARGPRYPLSTVEIRPGG
ncbi:MAG: hypothetical protein HOA41_00225, partial [Rhodospirillales bacterium]|nr:hypothetical protein [Rhodospirillales bacterium]